MLAAAGAAYGGRSWQGGMECGAREVVAVCMCSSSDGRRTVQLQHAACVWCVMHLLSGCGKGLAGVAAANASGRWLFGAQDMVAMSVC
jgi:hypothetical protein